MPWSPPRACPTPGCPRLLSAGQRCPEHQPSFTTSSYKSRPALPDRVRAAVLWRDGGRCQSCGAPAKEVDHRIPRSAGGSDDMTNLQALCGPCHRTKTGRQARAARTR